MKEFILEQAENLCFAGCGYYIVLCCIVRQNQCLGTGYCAVFVKFCRIFEI
ncbi:hypothetical protein NC653_034791 [Populus alba x Populus x berolinensis]|uniref:Uncharacterized protein n=1 Tax=Populus alba x Populus x berolinensis TaxID=444605 RepID=A0AAD6LNG0_9ROSI|nr:hypothetical protein NC653_034791 [Populus alba x Populus x berolinensis]